jgi:hypothetical protein
MGLFKQLMIFGKTGLQGLPTRVTLSLWVFSRQGATGVPLFTTWDSVAGSGRAPIPGSNSGRSRPRNNTQCSRSAVGRPPGQRWILGGITGGGPGYAAILAHAEGVLYGTELGSVTLKRVGLFCFPIKHSTHTRTVQLSFVRSFVRETFIDNQ